MIATMLSSTWNVHSIQLHLCNIEIKIQIVRDAHRAIGPSCFESPLLCPRHHGGRSVKMRYLMIVKHERDLPILSRLARRTLCIPATSAPSERVFSMAGLTVSNLRASLSSDNASSLIFLHDVWDIAEDFQSKRAQLHGGHHGQFVF